MYKKTVLDNGLRVITEEIPFFKSAAIGIWVDTGARDESCEINGISHFIEHMIFKGTETRNAAQIAELMDGVGGQLNAFTEKEHTCFYARVIDKHTPLAVELLFDMLLNSVFDPEEFERERKVILDEIRLYDDSPEDMIFDMFNNVLWKDHSMGRPILGTKSIIEAITRDNIFSYIDQNYRAENIIICAAGNVNHDDFSSMAEKYSKNLGNGITDKKRINVPSYEKRTKNKAKDCEQTYMIIGRDGLSATDTRKYCLSVLDSILGSSMSSRIFQEIREKRGLAYNVGSFASCLSDTGIFGIFAGTSPETAQEVNKLCIDITEKFRTTGPDEEEVSRAKEQLKGSLSLSLESTSGRMIRLAKSELYHKRMITPEEIFDKIDAVTFSDIMELSSWLLDTSIYSQAVLGPNA